MNDVVKWEYLVESVGSMMRGVNPEELQVGLNNLGEQGWEVVEVIQPQNSNKFWVVAKRPLTEVVQKQRIREMRGW